MKLLLSLAFCAVAVAQTPYDVAIQPSPVAYEIPINRGSAALWQSLKKLHTRASMLMITAHPDDEDGGMLTYESRGKGARVSLLTLNRGEGGANVMSPDYFDALGLVRTAELLAADRYYGVDQYWTRVIDYGFSKTMAESMDHWTRDRVLSDAVRVVRMVRPLVITSVFVGGESDGHGNHQTAGAMAQAVFKAAGDPNMFPDQIHAGLRPWAPVKTYGRVPFSGAQKLEANVTVPEGTFDPALGASYVQIAREGLGFQKSQNGGPNIPKAGPVAAAYHRFGSTLPPLAKEQDFFEGIDTSLLGIATLATGNNSKFVTEGLQKINAAVEEATAKFNAAKPEASAPALALGMKETIALLSLVEKSSLSDQAKYDLGHELNVKRAQFNNALAEALSLSLSATVAPEQEPNPRMAMFFGDPETFRVAIPGQSFGVTLHAVNQSRSQAVLTSLNVMSTEGPKWIVKDPPTLQLASTNGFIDAKFTVNVPRDAALTRPYFSRPDIEQSFYTISEDKYLNTPMTPYPLAGWAEWSYEGAPVRLGRYVQTVKRVTGLGTVMEPLIAGPAIGIQISPRFGVVPLDAKAFDVKTIIHSNVKGAASGQVHLDLPAGWSSQPASAPFTTQNEGDDRTVTFRVTPSNLSEKAYSITAVADFGGKQFREGYEATGYPGLARSYNLYRPSTYQTSGVDVKIAPGLKVGYVMGSGDDVPDSLVHLGVNVEFLTAPDLANSDLSKYDVILLGVRAYAARNELAAYNHRLLDYVKNGGVAIVQYNTPEFDHNFGPYPYVMGNNPEEVTDEASKVTILSPGNPVFNWPNKITAKDFDHWVEERGSKWMRTWDPHYEALLETHDQNQDPQKGGLLYARYGKGVYIYNAYAFYRQLPEGVPGAYRLFANMLSLPKNPQIR